MTLYGAGRSRNFTRNGDYQTQSTVPFVVVLWRLVSGTVQGRNMSDDPKLIRQIGKYRVVLVQSKCIAAASCVAISPAVYKLNEQNLVEFLDNPQDEEDNILLAAQSCPTGAIEIYEGETRVWPPES